jgi:glucosyl-3-phosphoglycerate phosphatase
MRRLLLVRHGVTEWNREGRFQGRLDPPLAPDGLVEARLLAARITAVPELRPARIVSSPLQRARQTAEVIGDDRPVVDDPRWVELGQGEWEGRTHVELAANDAARYADWRARAGEQPPPGAEPIETAFARVSAALDDALTADGWPLCIVSHGGALRLAARYLLGLAPLRAWAMDLDNASLSILVPRTAGEDWRVERWNDTGHLLGRGRLHVDESDGEPLAL